MGRKVELRAADGFEVGAYRADPAGVTQGRVVVIQEIFGVNSHIRNVCDRLALAGFTALAPQIFDRIERDFESGYSEQEVAHAREYIPRIDWEKLMLDVRAAVDTLEEEGPVAIIGFCLGGSVAFLAATQMNELVAAVSFYGGHVVKHADRNAHCPVQLHFGEADAGIPLSDVDEIRAKQPDAELYVYEGAGHGFNCDERPSYSPDNAAKAWERSIAFLAEAFGEAVVPMTEPPVPAATQIAKQGAAAGRTKPAAKAKARRKPAARKAKAAKKSKAKKGKARRPKAKVRATGPRKSKKKGAPKRKANVARKSKKRGKKRR